MPSLNLLKSLSDSPRLNLKKIIPKTQAQDISTHHKALQLSCIVKPLKYPPLSFAAKLTEFFLKVTWLNQKINSLSKRHSGDREKIAANLASEIFKEGKIQTNYLNGASIPKSGGCIIVANHEGYAIDDYLLFHEILKKRSDVKFIADKTIESIEMMAPWGITIDLLNSKKRNTQNNVLAFQEAIKWLKDEKLLIIFPEHSLQKSSKANTDHNDLPWSNLPIRLAEYNNTPIIPVKISLPKQGTMKYFHRKRIAAHNNNHPKLVSLYRILAGMLAFRQTYFLRRKTVTMTIGKSIIPGEDISKGNKLRDHVRQLDKAM